MLSNSSNIPRRPYVNIETYDVEKIKYTIEWNIVRKAIVDRENPFFIV